MVNFGPNKRAVFGDGPTFHHRSPTYSQLITDLETLFRDQANIPSSSSVLFMTGSGTLANEAVAFSLKQGVYVQGDECEFGSRLARQLAAHRTRIANFGTRCAWVDYETSCSRRNAFALAEEFSFVDAVSSFPYYMPNPEWDVWTTVNSKQLGGLPVVSVVVVSEKGWGHLMSSTTCYSYLNLARYRDFQYERKQSPHTPAIPLLADFRERLLRYDREAEVDKINAARAALMSALPGDAVIGTGPVLTIDEKFMPEGVPEEFGLYRGKKAWQVFLWAGDEAQVDALRKALKQ